MRDKESLLSNLMWKFAERITAQFVTLIVSIVLARLLEPSDYGVITIVMIFITLANVLVSDGVGSALIQKKNADALDFSSVLYFNVVFSIILYGALFGLAPFVANFYGEGYEILVPIFRVLGLRIIIAGINSVQQAYVSRNMMFKKFFWATFLGTVCSAIVGISMAYMGFGVWALVAQYLTNTIIDTIVLALSLKKRPILGFSIKRLKEIFNYGIKILSASLLITGYQEVRALIIGKVYSTADLAYYDKGRQFPNLVVTNINTSIGAVLFPKMSQEQDDINQIKRTTRMSIRFSAYIMCPMMLGLAVIAEPFVRIILTDKWIDCVPLLRMFCIVYLFQPIHTANMQVIKAVGRSDIYLKLEVVKKVIEVISLLLTIWISVEAMVIGMAVLTTLFTLINAYPNKKLISYSFKEQIVDIFPVLIMAMGMAFIVYLFVYIPIPELLRMLLQIICGAIIYVVMSAVGHNKEFKYIVSIIYNRFK